MPSLRAANPEKVRLGEEARRERNWQRWGPYLSERQWGTVREDYSSEGDAWRYFPHDHARSRAYRWGEDGLLGISDRECRLCFSVALWNGRDAILKERLFGLSGPEGNHGEDVKECYFYVDSTPTHSFMRALYKYPQAAFPYEQLITENRRRGREEPEYELLDTGVFDGDRYFDVEARYAKAGPNDLCIEILVANRGPEEAVLHVLPTLWFRNTWSWGQTDEDEAATKPSLRWAGNGHVQCEHATLGRFHLLMQAVDRAPAAEWLFTENESNVERLFHGTNVCPYVKDAFHAAVIEGKRDAVNPQRTGTKCAGHQLLTLPPGGEQVLRLRLFAEEERTIPSGHSAGALFAAEFAETMRRREREAEDFYADVMTRRRENPSAPNGVDTPGGSLSAGSAEDGTAMPMEEPELRKIARQAYAGLLWSKQFYSYVVRDWLKGDPAQPPPPATRRRGRNYQWCHLFARDVISMPDKWEYPWFAAWDLAFHMLPMAQVDPHFAKEQLNLLLREWYLHPNGQMPAYEWNFSDVNPPVHAWACWRVYKMSAPRGSRDRTWLTRVFQKLLLNFTWWVNRKDPDGQNIFSGGFLGLDNIGVFDRSKPLASGGQLEQADATAWMAFYCGTMLSIALELAEHDPAYEDIAGKFFEHFVAIADAMNGLGGTGLWHEGDGFYYDQVQLDGQTTPLRLRSMVGIIPLFAVEIIDQEKVARLSEFSKRTKWFIDHRKDLAGQISYLVRRGGAGAYLLAIPSRDRLERVLRYVLDESEFLSTYGVRSLSRAYRNKEFTLHLDGEAWTATYAPGESDTGLFGGNSNWRGPVWFPANYLLIEALERYHHFYGDSFTIEFPTGSGRRVTLDAVARELSRRLVRLFLPNESGRRPALGMEPRFVSDPHWRDLLWFHEYFHGETGQGLGASHQTGWTALVTRLVENLTK
ncbi:MAG TPA: hypothetical protein VHE61_07015 [Opitutaceae bacterium]|nr:hypothetical protein [Opitutaceae bacterium]